RVRIFSANTGEELLSILPTNSNGSYALEALAFSPDGRRLAAGSYDGDAIKIWDLTTGQQARLLSGQAPVSAIAVSPDSRWLRTASDSSVNLWDLQSRRRLASLWNGAANRVVFSPDGRWLAVNAGSRFPGETLKIWDTTNWTIAGEFAFDRGTPVFSMAFMPN